MDESIALLILRLLYEEKAGEVTLHGERTVLSEDFMEKLRALSDRRPKKTHTERILKRFQTLRLIRLLGAPTDPESVIVLYPSIPFALDGFAIEDLHAKLESYASAEKTADKGPNTVRVPADGEPDETDDEEFEEILVQNREEP